MPARPGGRRGGGVSCGAPAKGWGQGEGGIGAHHAGIAGPVQSLGALSSWRGGGPLWRAAEVAERRVAAVHPQPQPCAGVASLLTEQWALGPKTALESFPPAQRGLGTSTVFPHLSVLFCETGGLCSCLSEVKAAWSRAGKAAGQAQAQGAGTALGDAGLRGLVP